MRAYGLAFFLSIVLAPLARAFVPTWVMGAAASAPAAAPSGAKAVILLDETEVTVASADAITTKYRRVMKILTPAGRELASAAVPFDRDTTIRSLRGWSIDPAGREYEVRERDAVQVTPYAGELYSDARVKVLRLPAAEPGSIVAYEYEQRDRPYVLQTVWHFQDEVPRVRARITISMPEGWSYDARWSNHEPVAPLSGTKATWELRDVPAIGDEPRAPSPAALSGRLGLSFVPPSAEHSARAQRTWNDIAAWFLGLAAPRAAATPQLQRKVHELAPANAPADAVRALARFAQNDVRYVAIEIGIGGYQPHAAGEIFANRYGDCKDKATLLRAMLAEIGVESYYVLVHTTRGMIDPQFPTIEAFNHVVLAIRAPRAHHATIEHPRLGRLLIFDPTSTSTGFGDLPEYLQASRGLLVAPDGGELIDLPAHAPEVNQLRRTAKLNLDADGTLSGEVEEVRTGALAASMRGTLQPLTTIERARYFDSILASHLASCTASGLTIRGIDDAESDLVVRYTIRASGYGKHVAGLLLVRPRVLGEKAEAITNAAGRKYDYVTDGPSVQTDDISIQIDPSLTLDELPAATDVSSRFVQYSSKTELENDTLHYRRRFAMQSFVVEREAVPELARAFARISADERASAVFK